jgi:hypothetical protein
MSGRVLLATGAVCAALALLGGCSLGTQTDDSAPDPAPSASQPPPVGSIDHPRPVECVDGMTARVGTPRAGGSATGTATDPGTPAGSPLPASGRTPSSGTARPPTSSGGASGRIGPGDVRVGPLLWGGLGDLATGDQSAHGTQNADGWHYRLTPRLNAGAVVTVTIGAEQRARAGLEYGGGYGTAPAPAVTFHACTSTTFYTGGFFVAGDGRACVPLDVKVGDAPAQHIVISFFKGHCPA